MSEWQEAYPAVHEALAPEYRGLPREQVEAVLQASFGEGFGLDEAEGFFDDIGRTLSHVASAAAPVVQRVLPGVVSGAAGGAALGPFGALGGALLGGVTSALGGGGAPAGARAAPQPGAPGVPAPAAVPAGAGPTGAIGQLLAALGSPTVQQALNSMMLGRAGGRSVPTQSGGQLPVAAITSLLGMLANRASADWEAIVPSAEAEAESIGEGLDLAAPEVRAEWVLGQLAPLAIGRGEAEAREEESSEEGWVDELYDELEASLVGSDWEAAWDESAESQSWSLASDG